MYYTVREYKTWIEQWIEQWINNKAMNKAMYKAMNKAMNRAMNRAMKRAMKNKEIWNVPLHGGAQDTLVLVIYCGVFIIYW